MFNYELIEYTNHPIPIKWLIHGPEDSIGAVLPHWHTSIEISYIYKGAIESYKVNNTSYPPTTGSIFLINSAEVHASYSTYCATLEALTIQIPYQFFESLIPNFTSMRFENFLSGDSENVQKVRTNLDCFYQLVSNDATDLFDLQLLRLTYDLIYTLAEHWLISDTHQIHTKLYKENLGQIQPVITYIQTHYSKDLSVSKIAAQFHLSENYLNKLFKKHLGLSMMKYLQLVRLNKAHLLLINTEKSIQLISDSVGFPNEKSFRKIFREFFHQTPKKYQYNHHNPHIIK